MVITETNSLCQARCGQLVRVAKLTADPALSQRLREMGFCENAQVKVIQKGACLLCQVCGAKVGLSHELAGSILVSAA